MIDLKARIATLPEWPGVGHYTPASATINALLARLDLLHDLIRERLVDGCAECGGTNVCRALNTDADLRPVGDWYDAPCPTCADWRALLEVTKP